MSLVSKRVFFLTVALAALFLSALPSDAATVVVNRAGGGDYTSISAAVSDFGTWSDATGDTILVTDDDVNPATGTISTPAGADLTIQNNTGDTPVIEITSGAEVFRLNNGGALTLDGLAMIGESGVTSGGSRAIRCDPGAAGTLTVRNCIFSMNDGTDNPRTDVSAGPPVPFGFSSTPGAMGQYIRIINGTAPIQVVIEDSFFGFHVDGAAFTMDQTADPGSSINIDNCIFAHGLEFLFRINNFNNPNMPVNVRNCAFVNGGTNRGILLGHEGVAADVLFEDCVYRSLINEFNIDTSDSGLFGFEGTLTINRCSFVGNDNYDSTNIFLRKVSTPANVTVVITDTIFANNDGSALRTWDFFGNEGAELTNLTLANVAVSNFTSNPSGYRSDAHATVKAAFDNLYGGTGPLTANPVFEASDTTVFDGLNSWDSSTNNFLDVGGSVGGSPYCGAGSGGSDLSGGAEMTTGACGPVLVVGWDQY